MAYLLDANVFIQAKNDYYGFDLAPGFWEWLDREHENGNVFSVDKVRDELIEYGDHLSDWAKARGSDFFLPPDNLVAMSLTTLATWAGGGDYENVAVNQFLSGADYYLVAHAHAYGFEVVTHEVPAASRKKIKIPNACIAVNAKYLTTFQMLRREKAKLVLAAAV